MRCETAREALSARLDGEPGPVPDADVAAHVAACADCDGWRAAADAVTRRVRVAAAPHAPDLADAVPTAMARAAGAVPRREIAS